MFVHMTVVRIEAARVGEAVEGRSTRFELKNLPEGLRQSYVLESMDEPGKLIWLSFWDSPGEAKAFITSLGYAGELGELQNFLLSGPEWQSYRVLERMDLREEPHIENQV